MASGRQGAKQAQIQCKDHHPIAGGGTEQRGQSLHRTDGPDWGRFRGAAVLQLGLAKEDHPLRPAAAAALGRQLGQHSRIGSGHRRQGSAAELLPAPSQECAGWGRRWLLGSEQGIPQLQDGTTPEPPPAGGVSAVQALTPLVSVASSDGVVVLALDLRLLGPLPP